METAIQSSGTFRIQPEERGASWLIGKDWERPGCTGVHAAASGWGGGRRRFQPVCWLFVDLSRANDGSSKIYTSGHFSARPGFSLVMAAHQSRPWLFQIRPGWRSRRPERVFHFLNLRRRNRWPAFIFPSDETAPPPPLLDRCFSKQPLQPFPPPPTVALFSATGPHGL